MKPNFTDFFENQEPRVKTQDTRNKTKDTRHKKQKTKNKKQKRSNQQLTTKIQLIKVLHNNVCSKSKSVLEYLDENNVAFEVIDIVNQPLSELEIRTLLKKLQMQPIEIVRTNEALFQNQYSEKDFSDDDWIKILSENPSLIQRPILIKGSVAMIGRPIENVKFFIEK